MSVTLSGGRLAPGFGDETGSSDEIELKVDLGGGNDILTVIGTPEPMRSAPGPRAP